MVEDPEDEDAPEEEAPDDEAGESLDAMHTPEQARLQQSDHDEQVTPSALHAPPVPPSVDCSHGSVVALAAQPATIAISVPSPIAVAWFMTSHFATDVPPVRRSASGRNGACSHRVEVVAWAPPADPMACRGPVK